MSAVRLKANLQAKDFISTVKSGVVLKGIVRSVDDSTNSAWVALEFPAIDERRVQVKNAGHPRPGDIVSFQCVPNPLRPEHYLFRVVPAPTQQPPAKHWILFRLFSTSG